MSDYRDDIKDSVWRGSFTREECFRLLCDKAEELGRLPNRDDFPPGYAVKIKEKLGPWPRALEAAGLKQETEKRLAKIKRRYATRIKKKRNRSSKPESIIDNGTDAGDNYA